MPGGVKGEGKVFAIENHAEPALASLRYKLKDADMQAAEEAFEAGRKEICRRNVVVKGVDRGATRRCGERAGIAAIALVGAPSVKAASAARGADPCAAYLAEHADGRLVAADAGQTQIPYDYTSTQTIAQARICAKSTT